MKYKESKLTSVCLPLKYLKQLETLAKELNVTKNALIVLSVRYTLQRYALIPLNDMNIRTSKYLEQKVINDDFNQI